MNTNQSEFIILNQLLVFLITAKDAKISNVLTQIRALKGVVTLSVYEATHSMNSNQHLTKIRVKFLGLSKNLKMNLKAFKIGMKQITGVETVIIKIRRSDIKNINK